MHTLPTHYLGDETLGDDTTAGLCPWGERERETYECPNGCLLPPEK